MWPTPIAHIPIEPIPTTPTLDSCSHAGIYTSNPNSSIQHEVLSIFFISACSQKVCVYIHTSSSLFTKIPNGKGVPLKKYTNTCVVCTTYILLQPNTICCHCLKRTRSCHKTLRRCVTFLKWSIYRESMHAVCSKIKWSRVWLVTHIPSI